MNERYRSELSELLDGELDSGKLGTCLRRLEGDGEYRARFDRYVMAREYLRGNAPDAAARGFCERVMAALESEPTVVAPARPGRGGNRPGRMLRPAAGFAIAASVAAVAILGLRQSGVPEGPVPERPTTAQSMESGAESRGSGAAPETTASAPRLQYVDARLRTPLAQPAGAGDRAWLNTYLLRHNEAVGTSGRGGFIPYVHIVTRDVRAGNGDSERTLRSVNGNPQPE